jgi:hypothetical protein
VGCATPQQPTAVHCDQGRPQRAQQQAAAAALAG